MHWLLIAAFAFDLAAVSSEPNLERRSERALDNATVALMAAREAYVAGDQAKAQAGLDEVRDSVDLAYQSLKDSGKTPRNNKYYKRAELRTRDLARHLEGLRDTFSLLDRPLVDRVRDHVNEVHDMLLQGILSRKR
jgi:hypothetical protein